MIIFASMDGCPHCENAKKALNQLINSGKVKIISPNETTAIFKDKVRGFPAFKNTVNDKETVGFRSVENLMKELGEVPVSDTQNADIVFFKLNRCGFCTRALDLLKNEIASGKIKVAEHTLAPKEATGFPFFMNTKNGKTVSGLPQSVSDLYEKLGYVENFRHTRKLAPQYREHYIPPKDHRADKYKSYAARSQQMQEQQMREQQMQKQQNHVQQMHKQQKHVQQMHQEYKAQQMHQEAYKSQRQENQLPTPTVISESKWSFGVL